MFNIKVASACGYDIIVVDTGACVQILGGVTCTCDG